MVNSNLGLINIREKSISAASIGNLPPLLDDHEQVISTAYGISAERNSNQEIISSRRYVGFKHGRVTEYTRYVELGKYLDWVDRIIDIVDGRSTPLNIFNRFAEEIKPPNNPNPLNILLDLSNVENDFVTNGSFDLKPGDALNISDICLPVNNGSFTLNANGKNLSVSINYDEQKQKYMLNSHILKSIYEHKEKLFPSLVDYLNREQAFRIIPDTKNTIYANGGFFRPFDIHNEKINAEELNFIYLLEPISELSTIGEEKGKIPFTNNSKWPNDSLFHFIDSLGENTQGESLFGKPDILVCDDMDSEIADFILADFKLQKVVFIHAKASSNQSYVSAGNLSIICSQACKNLGYLSAYQIYNPKDNINKWNKPWSSNGQVVTKRIRRGEGNGEEIWQQISSLLRNPNTHREVWLVLGQILSKNRFIADLNNKNTTPNAIQLAYLLRSTLSNISSIGGRLRILCSE
mgnify:CR=1 FL=1|jgi:hypothetical protein